MSNWMYERKPWETLEDYGRRIRERQAAERHYGMMRSLQASHYSGMNLQPDVYYENDILKIKEEEQKERNKKLILLL